MIRFGMRQGKKLGAAVATYVAIGLVTLPPASAEETTTPDFTEFSLEALTNLEVISVSKRPERMNDAAAAIFVITADEIRRSGATSIPEVLRMVPGMDVARIDAQQVGGVRPRLQRRASPTSSWC